jgi:hypothetical protein
MDKWEYKLTSYIVLLNIDKLNEMGELGWELVMRDNFTVIFKRRKVI